MMQIQSGNRIQFAATVTKAENFGVVPEIEAALERHKEILESADTDEIAIELERREVMGHTKLWLHATNLLDPDDRYDGIILDHGEDEHAIAPRFDSFVKSWLEI